MFKVGSYFFINVIILSRRKLKYSMGMENHDYYEILRGNC